MGSASDGNWFRRTGITLNGVGESSGTSSYVDNVLSPDAFIHNARPITLADILTTFLFVVIHVRSDIII
ncbi:hypothetical protein F443_16651 [Phytophthora nicotianae P1569]|uniref:Uncharacterized protein n=1 Tax=Phytophthora nicotianae P1569 TaxID=1317065 RepID=V9EH26_PHYNI|nr:hypothetical protein F443_16651 [Phytophthora nicotianae P1569]